MPRSLGPEAMIGDFAQPAWAEAHEKFPADVASGLAARLAAGCGAAKDETPATSHHGKGRRQRTPAR
jgi:hypothetical protein